MSEASLIVSIQNDIGEINANMMKVNRSAVFFNNNKIKVVTLKNNLMFAREYIAIALKHLDLLEAL
jgi:3-polyprenyl-4-hydroxybenzoate decarboxylase